MDISQKDSTMIKHCLGCGIVLQNKDQEKDGYVQDITNDLCERCFRIEHYNEYKVVSKENQDYVKIIKKIPSNHLIVVVLSLFEFGSLEKINSLFGENIILCLTKRDILPKSLIDEKIKKYFYNKVHCLETLVISSIKNYQLDALYDAILKYSHGKDVYVVGYTNSGKSTLINKFIKNYSDLKIKITESRYPSTTLDTIRIPLKEFTLIDTPGLIDEGNIVHYLDVKLLKKYQVNKEIKPKIYQIRQSGMLVIDDLLVVKYHSLKEKSSLILFMNPSVNILHTAFKEDVKCNIDKGKFIVSNQEIVMEGLCFFKVVGSVELEIYTKYDISIDIRESLID